MRTAARARLLAAILGGIAALSLTSGPALAAPRPTTLQVTTVPALPSVRLTLDGTAFSTNRNGVALIPHSGSSLAGRLRVQRSSVADGVRASLARWNGQLGLENVDHLTARLDVRYRVSLSFVDLQRKPVDLSRVTSVLLRSSHGILHRLSQAQLAKPIWLHGTRVVSRQDGPEPKEIYYTVDRVIVDGANVVNRSQQRFFPVKRRAIKVELLFFKARFVARDALLKFPIGSAVRLRHPDGHWEQYPLGPAATLELTGLPRGDYMVTLDAPGMSFLRPVSLSRDQEVELEVLSYIDMGLGLSLFVLTTVGLLLIGRPHLLGYVRPVLIPARAARRLLSRRVSR